MEQVFRDCGFARIDVSEDSDVASAMHGDPQGARPQKQKGDTWLQISPL